MNEYIVVGYKCNNAGDVIECYVCPVVEGVNKSGIPYGFIKTDQRFTIAESLPIGKRIKMNLVKV